MEIFQHAPAYFADERNKSVNFLNSLDRSPLMKMPKEMTRLDHVFQQINLRMFEKFKGFRQGFRTFDKNFDG